MQNNCRHNKGADAGACSKSACNRDSIHQHMQHEADEGRNPYRTGDMVGLLTKVEMRNEIVLRKMHREIPSEYHVHHGDGNHETARKGDHDIKISRAPDSTSGYERSTHDIGERGNDCRQQRGERHSTSASESRSAAAASTVLNTIAGDLSHGCPRHAFSATAAYRSSPRDCNRYNHLSLRPIA